MFPAIVAAVIRLLRAALRTAGRSPRRVSASRIAAVAGFVVLCAVPGAVAASPVTVTVATGSSLGTLSTQISSNNTWSGLVDQNATSKSNFAALKLPMVRLHVGDDGGAPAMPEIKQNQWSFANLDTLVNDETSIGQQVVMNVKFAPDWMWTCTKYQGAGDIADKTFKTYAAYMARLVSYYNKGSMTTETGQVITNPAGTSNRVTYWELWNEPDLSNETPCNPPDGMALTPAEYLTMWNAVAPAMLAVDPTLKFIGPATAGGQFGSGSGGANNDYITTLMQSGNPKPYALSFHGYGYWDNGVTDNTMFVGDGTPGVNGGIDDMVAAATDVHKTYPSLPVWITEVNVNAAWGDDPHGRPWGPFAAAWWGTAFADLVPQNMALIHQYDISSQPQFGLISDENGTTRLPYWIVKTLNAAFPVNSTRLSVSSPDANVKVLAARRPDGKLSILVVDKRVDSANPSGGVGLAADVNVSLDASASAVTLQQIDSSTSPTSGPATVNLTPSQTIPLHFPGYGLAVLTVSTGAPPPPAPGASLSPSSLSFASQTVGTTSAAKSSTLTNTGNAALTISGMSVTGSNAGDFAQTSDCPSSLAAGASCSISATFTPSASGARSASVSITDNASGSPHQLALSGTGSTSTPPPPGPAVSLSPASLTYASQAIATTSAAKSSTLTNTGNAPLTISSMSMTGANPTDFARTTTCPLSPSTLAAGASCSISVTFTPSASGTRTASVSITDNAPGSPHQLALSGTGGTVATPFNWAANNSADFDADHMTDLGSLYRGRSPQDSLWYDLSSAGGSAFQIYFGATADVPVAGDYDGDGKTDAVIFRPSTGLWYGPRTGAAQIVIQTYLGQAGDIPVPGDYDGDKKTDPAIFRPSSGLFFAVLSGGGTLGKMLGQSGDVPVARDYDGDGKTDFAYYRPSTGAWQAQLSGGGTYSATNGKPGDIPVPADYNGDRRADCVVFRPSSGLWTGPYEGASGTFSATLGQSGDIPIPGYYDNNKKVDVAIYRPSSGLWYATLSGGGTKRVDGLGATGDVPLQRRPKLAGGL